MQIRKTTLALAAAALCGTGAVGGWAIPTFAGADVTPAAAVPAGTAKTPVPLGSAPNYRAIVQQNRDAVVSVTTLGESPASMSMPEGMSPDDPFFRFFRGMPQNRMPSHGLGSGFIVNSDGVILTNAHVVDGAQRVTVKLSDRREFKARVVGVDKTTDIAVLKIDAHDLPAVRLGDSDQLAVGDYVLAIGAPYGLEETATAGIVSAKGRSLPDDTTVPFIQTDVAVNPGNSGGPLFDSSGAVVGINSQLYSNTGGYQGVSFAIPIDVALHIRDQILEHGKVEHARLGVVVQSVDQSLADSFGLPAPGGALISKVEPDSAAAKAGLKPGDVILKVAGEPLNDAGQLSARMGLAAPGDSISLEIWRDHKSRSIDARLGEVPGVADSGTDAASGSHGKLGLAVRALTPEERAQAGIEGGVLVQGVSGPAADAGIRPGDVVLSVNDTMVTSAQQLRDAVSQNKGRVALLIQRGDSRSYIPVDVG